MRIGILGAGNVGSSLGKAWAARGHEIVFGVRDPQSDKAQVALKALGSQARAASIKDAASFGEVVVLAVSGSGVEDVLQAAGDLTGKILVDATNRVGTAPVGGAPSGAEDVARLASGARVVKAFNTIGFNIMANPRFGSQNADLYICGDDAEAKAVVTRLATEIGFDVVDIGPLSNANLLESLALLWIRLSRSMGRNIAFKLLRRD